MFEAIYDQEIGVIRIVEIPTMRMVQLTEEDSTPLTAYELNELKREVRRFVASKRTPEKMGEFFSGFIEIHSKRIARAIRSGQLGGIFPGTDQIDLLTFIDSCADRFVSMPEAMERMGKSRKTLKKMFDYGKIGGQDSGTTERAIIEIFESDVVKFEAKRHELPAALLESICQALDRGVSDSKIISAITALSAEDDSAKTEPKVGLTSVTAQSRSSTPSLNSSESATEIESPSTLNEAAIFLEQAKAKILETPISEMEEEIKREFSFLINDMIDFVSE